MFVVVHVGRSVDQDCQTFPSGFLCGCMFDIVFQCGDMHTNAMMLAAVVCLTLCFSMAVSNQVSIL